MPDVNQLLQLAGSAAGAAAFMQGGTLLLRRMNRRQVAAETKKANAEAKKADVEADVHDQKIELEKDAALVTVGQYLRSELAAATADATAARTEARAAAAESRAARQDLEAMHDLLIAHEPWDRRMLAAAKARGETPADPPPLRLDR